LSKALFNDRLMDEERDMQFERLVSGAVSEMD
jgi:hypothetical protein